MAKLWEKNYRLNEEIERYTVGSDYMFDNRLIQVDCAGNAAHATMLASIGVLTEKERDDVVAALVEIMRAAAGGDFTVKAADEDVHTAVENELTKRLGETGKKIHTARSRNDQVILDQRLWLLENLLDALRLVLDCAGALVSFAEKHKDVPMVGRTHMQPAMPSSVGLWAAAFAESLLDDTSLLRSAYDLADQCPLGSAASYGVPLDINRELVAELLGFSRVQNNVLYVNNSRGKIELVAVSALSQVMLDLSKLAQDVILFSMPEFGYFRQPKELCSGSSLMPQKRNPCAMELLRAKSAAVLALQQQIANTIRALPSGYNRDYQETKEPFMKAFDITAASVRIATLTMEKLEVDEEKCIAGFHPGVFATDRALELVLEGKPFRDAYKEVGLNLDKLADRDPKEAVKQRKHTGAPGNLRLDLARSRIKELQSFVESEVSRRNETLSKLLGTDYPGLSA